MKFKSFYNYDYVQSKGFFNTKPSETIQDDTLSIQQMFLAAQVNDPTLYREGSYDDSVDLDIDDDTYADELEMRDELRASTTRLKESAINDDFNRIKSDSSSTPPLTPSTDSETA